MTSKSSSPQALITQPKQIQNTLKIGFSQDINIKYKANMEDRFVEQFNLTEDGNVVAVGVLDGHGGSQAVEFIQKNLPLVMKEHYSTLGSDVPNYFKEVFNFVNQ